MEKVILSTATTFASVLVVLFGVGVLALTGTKLYKRDALQLGRALTYLFAITLYLLFAIGLFALVLLGACRFGHYIWY